MKVTKALTLIGLSLLWATVCVAQQLPAGAPAGATGLCKDGTYWSGAAKRGACRGHKGIKQWYGVTGGSAAAPPAPAASPSPTAASSSPTAASAVARSARRAPPAPSATAAPGGSPGLVWVNHKSKVYHCLGARYYGKTKDGEYMSEADAKAKGYRPDHHKPCT